MDTVLNLVLEAVGIGMLAVLGVFVLLFVGFLVTGAIWAGNRFLRG